MDARETHIDSVIDLDDCTLTINDVTCTTVTGGSVLDFDSLWGPSPNLNLSDTITLSGLTDHYPTTSMSGVLKAEDIELQGQSVMRTLQDIQQRLNLLVPNLQLETEWHELRALGDAYRELEARCLEKSKMWQQIKSMPPPETP